jgi:serine/threonine protein phosphatase PrpC
MQFKVGFKTDIGRKRSQNQDSGISIPELGLFIVADGMGGHRGGETASTTAVETISQCIRKSTQLKNWNTEKSLHEKSLIEAFHNANQAIYDRSVKEPALQGMGTTTIALLFKDHNLMIGHVGDSRCYFFRPQAIWQATRDHSLVQEKLRAGLITRKDVKTDRMKNVITRSVGFEEKVNVDIYHMEVQSGDTFLLCSDGLSGLVEDLDILKIVQKDLFTENDPQKTVVDLIDAANANGGDDNITSIIVQVI